MAPELLILAALAGALLALGLARLGSRAWRRLRLRLRTRRARKGELEAAALLRRQGYRVLDEQLRQRGHMLVDGERLEFEVRADLLATRGGRTYVVEVKTGTRAPNPRSSATRRQLREYAAVYEADGLLLADMQAQELRAIEFPGAVAPTRSWGLAAVFVLGLAAGVGLAMLVGA